MTEREFYSVLSIHCDNAVINNFKNLNMYMLVKDELKQVTGFKTKEAKALKVSEIVERKLEELTAEYELGMNNIQTRQDFLNRLSSKENDEHLTENEFYDMLESMRVFDEDIISNLRKWDVYSLIVEDLRILENEWAENGLVRNLEFVERATGLVIPKLKAMLEQAEEDDIRDSQNGSQDDTLGDMTEEEYYASLSEVFPEDIIESMRANRTYQYLRGEK